MKQLITFLILSGIQHYLYIMCFGWPMTQWDDVSKGFFIFCNLVVALVIGGITLDKKLSK